MDPLRTSQSRTREPQLSATFFSQEALLKVAWVALMLLIASPADLPAQNGGSADPPAAPIITPAANALPMHDMSGVQRYISRPVFAENHLAIGTLAEVPGMVGEYPLVLIWRRDGSQFTQTQALQTDLPPESNFATALAMNTNTLAVGAPGASVENVPRAGRVLLYFRGSPEEPFYQVQELTSPEPETSGNFGTSVAFHGNLLLVGAPEEQVAREGSVLSKGVVYVYEPAENGAGNSWSLRMRLAADAQESSRAFGQVLAAEEGVAVVADPEASSRDEPGWLGSVHLLSAQPEPDLPVKETGRINLKSSTESVNLHVGTALALSRRHLVLSCEVRDNQGGSQQYADRLLILDFDPAKMREDQAAIATQQVLVLPDGLKIAGSGSLATYRDLISVRAISISSPVRGEILLYQRDPQLPDGSQWALQSRLLAPHMPIFGRTAVDFAEFTAFADSQLLTVLSRTRPGASGEVNTALVAYPLSRLIRGGSDSDSVDLPDPEGIENQATRLLQENLQINTSTLKIEPRDNGQLMITRPSQARTDYMGRSLLTTENFLIAGAPAGEEIGVESGSVLILPRPIESGNTEAWEIRISQQLQADDFGRNMAFSNGVLAVTASRFGEDFQDFPGAVLFFQLNPDRAPEFLHILTAPDEEESAAFGSSLAMNEENLFIGAPGQSKGGTDFPPKVFHYSGEPQSPVGWNLQQVLQHPQGEVFSRFGQTLLLAEDLLAVGAPSASGERGERTGLVYVYSRHRGGRNSYSLLTDLKGLQTGAQAEFGSALAYSANALWVSAPGEMVRSEDVTVGSIHNRNQGAVYQFRRDYPRVDNWTQVTHLVDPRGHRNQRFGESLLYDPAANRLVVGAPGSIAGDEPTTAGAAIFFTRQTPLSTGRGTETWQKLGSLTSPLPVAKGLYGVALAQADQQIFSAAMRTTTSSVQRGGAICVIDARQQSLQPLLAQAEEKREAARAEEIKRQEDLLRAQQQPEPEAESTPVEPETPAPSPTPENSVRGRQWEVLAEKAGAYTLYKSPPQAAGLLQAGQISPLTGGLLLQRTAAEAEAGLPLYLALQADGILTPIARELIPAEPPAGGHPPTDSPLQRPAHTLASSGRTIAMAHPSGEKIDLLFLTESPRGGWPVQWEQLEPGQARKNYGNHLALHEELVAVGDNTGTYLYRLAAPSGKVTGIFEGRLEVDTPLLHDPVLSMRAELLLQAGFSFDGQGQENAVPRVSVLLYPRRAYGFRNRAEQQITLPLTLGLQPAAAARGERHQLTTLADNDVAIVAAPDYSQAYLITQQGSGDEWKVALQISSLQEGPLATHMVNTGTHILMTAPSPDTLYSFTRQSGGWTVEKLVLPPALTQSSPITSLAFSNNLLWIALQNGTLLSLPAPDIIDYLLALDENDLVLEDNPRSLQELLAETEAAHEQAQVARQQAPVEAQRTWHFVSAPEKASAQFGAAMICSGQLLLVSDPGAPTKSGALGGVWVYRRTTPQTLDWQLSGLIPNPSGVGKSGFGASLAYSQTTGTLAVGAPEAALTYVFQLAESSVRLLATLNAPGDWENAGNFGHALAFIDSTLAVGSPEAVVNGVASGTVALFSPSPDGTRFDPAGSVPLPQSLAGGEGALFGQALVSHDGIIAVGAPGARSRTRHGQKNDGAVFLYKSLNSRWEMLKELSPTSSIGSNSFGATLAMGDQHLLVGAPHADMLNVSRPGRINDKQGAIHLFSKRGTLDDWIFKKTLTAEPGGNNLLFGSSMAVSQDQILAGASGAQSNNRTAPASEALFSFIKPNDVSDIWRQVPLPQFPEEFIPRRIGQSLVLVDQTFYSTAVLENGRAGICISLPPNPGDL